MNKRESRKIVDSVALSNAVFIECQDSIYLDSILTQKQSVPVVEDGFDLFSDDNVSLTAIKGSQGVDRADNKSIFLSNYSKGDAINSTFLLDTVIAMTIRLASKNNDKIYLDQIASLCTINGVTDKFPVDTKLQTKLTARLRSHISANNGRPNSALYKQCRVENVTVSVKGMPVERKLLTVSDSIKTLCCSSDLIMGY